MLKVKNLQKRYGDFQLDCSLTVRPGRVTGLVGRNGSGKSTTFKAVLGLIRPDGGTVRCFGKDPQEFSAADRAKIGVVLPDSGFSGYLRGRDVVAILRELYPRFDQDFFIQQAQHMQLSLDVPLKEFSTGMRAKFKFLVALSHRARLLVLDEPTAGLDVVARDEILDLLRRYLEEDAQRSILISSHISSDLESLCDDFYLIDSGRIILHEDTDVLLSDYAFLKVSADDFADLDQQYILQAQETDYGYCCLTRQKQYYHENYPQIVIEPGSIDKIMSMAATSATQKEVK